MRKIALISPPQPYLITHHTQVPLGLLYLSAVVKRDCPGWEVQVLDYSAETPEVIPYADVYGFTATTLDYRAAVALKDRIVQWYPYSTHIVGGPHVTAVPEDGEADFDVAFIGEAETTLPAFLTTFPAAHHRGRRQASTPVDLTPLPYPDRDALDWLGGRVLTSEHGQSVNIMASRGCPYRCAFCASQVMWPGPVRWRTPEAVVAEMRYCIEKYGAKVFRFSDDNMTSNRPWTTEFCKLAGPLGVRWRLSCRVDRVDPKLLARMRAAGCEEMGLGVESFDQAVLDILAKGQAVEQATQAVEMLHAAGIGARILLMVNTPGETVSTISSNIAALERLRGEFAYVSAKVFMPLPGSPIWNDPARFGIEIVSRDIARYNFFTYQKHGLSHWSPIRISGMTAEQQDNNAVKMIEYLESLPETARGAL